LSSLLHDEHKTTNIPDAEKTARMIKQKQSFNTPNASMGIHGTFGTSNYTYAKKNPLLFRPKSTAPGISKELKPTHTVYSNSGK
jgi:hypothetical protein